MTLRALDPTAFDHTYPVLGKLLASEQGYDEFLSDHTFSRLLCKHTPFLWRVVAGDIFYHRIHPWLTPPPFPDGPPLLQVGGSPGGSPSGGGGSPGGNPGGSGGPFHTESAPEPSSWVLMASGLVLWLTLHWRCRRRFPRIPTPV
jgi:hypothetical protein